VKELRFQQLEQHFIDEYKSTATLYRHQETGAEVMSVTNDNENKERLHRDNTHIGTQCVVWLKEVSVEGAICRTA
jgi:hypothetical protein